jgi:hypothetical protein
MLDLSYFQNQNSNVQGFFSGGTWQTWIKPRGAKLVTIICQGSGAGGGGGRQSASTPRAGGGGGGSGATARLIIDARLLPDILYILPGIGGAGGLGGTTATSGSSGQNSFVTLIPDTSSVSNVVLRSGTTPAAGGPAGTTANTANAAGETISVITNNIFSNLGIFTFQAGVIGGIGGVTNGQGLVTIINFTINSGGGGGTGISGTVAAAGVFPGVASTPVNTNGQNGNILYKPTLMLYGGRGGGGSSAASTNGGNAGNGAPGCGGGGGGASTNTGVNAGNGGRGGDGFVIITTSL